MKPCQKLIGPHAQPCGDPAPHWRWHPVCGDCYAQGHDLCIGHALCNGHAAMAPT